MSKQEMIESILLEYGSKVIDAHNGKTNPTIGELLEEPTQKLMALLEEPINTA